LTVPIAEVGISADDAFAFAAAAVECEKATGVEAGGDEWWLGRRATEAREGHLLLRRQTLHHVL
jgi:hypothetical protein